MRTKSACTHSLHFTFASGIGMGHMRVPSPTVQSFPSFSSPASSVRECIYEIDRENRVGIGRVSDREAGKSADSLPCVLYICSFYLTGFY